MAKDRIFPNILTPPGCLPGETPKECRERRAREKEEGKGAAKTYGQTKKEK
jgi:hypothetical protein